MEPMTITALASAGISTVSTFIGAQNQKAVVEANNKADFIRRQAQIAFQDSRRRAYNRNVMRAMTHEINKLEYQRLDSSYDEVVAKVELQKKMMMNKGRINAVLASKGQLDARSSQAVDVRLEAEYEQQLERINEEAYDNEIKSIMAIKAVKGRAFNQMDKSFDIVGSERPTDINPLTAGLTAGINTFVSQGGVNSLVGSMIPSGTG